MKYKKNIPFKNRRYYDYKKKTFDGIEHISEEVFRLERFGNFPAHTGIGYIGYIVAFKFDYPVTIEGQRIEFNQFMKRDGKFVDIGGANYYKDNERSIDMVGSYYHGFHYFETYEEAEEIQKLFELTPSEIYPISVYNSTAQGYINNVKTHVATKIYIHES